MLNEADDLSVFPDAQFDFIYSNIALQHMSPSLALSYIREFIRVLKADGIAIFQLPSRDLSPSKEPTWKRVVKLVTPLPVIKAVRRIRGVSEERMEMHCINSSEVLSAVHAAGGEVLDSVRDTFAGTNYESIRYCIRRRAQKS